MGTGSSGWIVSGAKKPPQEGIDIVEESTGAPCTRSTPPRDVESGLSDTQARGTVRLCRLGDCGAKRRRGARGTAGPDGLPGRPAREEFVLGAHTGQDLRREQVLVTAETEAEDRTARATEHEPRVYFRRRKRRRRRRRRR